ncbi:MAG: hypothetical protein NTV54_05080 [Ignavibacteriales bacterium]|nr:hypothetical protein [Ignavibacteriales bacterium]
MRLSCLLALVLIVLPISGTAQDTLYVKKSELAAKTTELGKNIAQLRRSSAELHRALNKQQRKLTQMDSRIAEERLLAEHMSDSLKIIVANSEKSIVQTQTDVTTMRSSMNQHVIMWMVAILGLLLFGVVLGGLLQRRMVSAVAAVDKRLDATKLELETKTIKLDHKVVELLGTQLLLLKSKQADQIVQCKGTTKNGNQCTRKAARGSSYCTQHAQ